MLIQTKKQYKQVMECVISAPLFSIDTETTGLEPEHGDLVIGVSLYFPETKQAYYLPIRHEVGENLPFECYQQLAVLTGDSGKKCLGWNLSFDASMLLVDDIPLFARWADCMIASHLLDENDTNRHLKPTADRLLGENESAPEQELMRKLNAIKLQIDQGEPDGKKRVAKQYMKYLTPEEVAPYAEADAVLPYRLLSEVYQPFLEKEKLVSLWHEVNLYSQAIMSMKRGGVLIDASRCRQFSQEAFAKAESIRDEIRRITKIKTFNPGSPVQIQKFLNIPTTVAVELVKNESPIVPLLLQYRSWSKADDSYYSVFLERMDGNGRIHMDLGVTGTITGRLSCRKPNMQALPRIGKTIYKVRNLVVAPAHCSLLAFDYSQIELRLLAHYTKDPFLLDIYRTGKDIHAETAKLMKIDRQRAKTFNYSVIYGIGPTELALQFKVPEKEAKMYLDRYYRQVPGVRKLYYDMDAQAKRDDFITMWTGRRRHYNGGMYETWKAMSNLIQGGVGEIVRIATTNLWDYLRHTPVKMILNIHDELLFECPTNQTDKWGLDIKGVMEDFQFEIPIVIEPKIGTCWSDVAPFEPKGVLKQGRMLDDTNL